MDKYVSETQEGGLWQAAVTATTDLLTIFPFAEFFNTAAANLAKLLNADGAALIVRDGPGQLRYKLFYGLDHLNQESITQFSFSDSQGTAGYVLATGQPLFTQDYPDSENAMTEFVDAGLRSNFVLPLPGFDGYAGAIAVAWFQRQSGPPEASNLAVARMFAALLGSAVYREGLQKQLEALSLTDPLTGLPNRRALMMRLSEAQKRAFRNQTLLVLATLDLDGFKAVNDRLGHATGDRELLTATAAVRNTIRDIDMLVRTGGDEFVLVLEDLRSVHEVEAILHRIVRAVYRDINENNESHKITASIGAAVYPFDFAAPETLLKHADTAMYHAKRNGGNQFHLHFVA